jgi:hypothetical protein
MHFFLQICIGSEHSENVCEKSLPAVVWDEDESVQQVADDAVERPAVGEAAMTTAIRHNEYVSDERTNVAPGPYASIWLGGEEAETYQSCPRTKSAQNMVPWTAQ